MTSNRRNFLRQAAVLTGAFSATSIFNQLHAEEWLSAERAISNLSPQQIEQEEDYWSMIQRSYTENPGMINLNNGGV